MATYLPGVTDYIPEIQPFRPDYNFYSGALQMKQGQYDANHKQLSNLYGSLLNAPMLRDQNIKSRDEFFKTISGEIKQISGMDLSLQENVESASNLFTQLYDNQNIVKDMVWTKNYQSELTRAENFRNCVDPEKCGGAYWDGGVKALNYKADEFRKASDQDALGMGNVKYAAYQNVMEKAVKAAKDAGLNIEVDQLNGRYIYTTKNGPNLVRPLSDLFTGLFASDPLIQEYYKTQAYVNRKDFVFGNMTQYGSEDAAEQAYADQITQGMQNMFGGMQEDIEFQKDNIKGQKAQYEERIRTKGTIPNSPLARKYQELNEYGEQIDATGEVLKTTNGYIKNASDPALRRSQGANLDNVMASFLLQGDISSAAQTLAYKDYSVKMEADPYALENVKQSNRLALEEVKFKYDIALEKFKFQMEDFDAQQQDKGSSVDNIPITKNDVVGGASINLEEDGAAVVYEEMVTEQRKDFSGSERAVIDQFINLTKEHSKNPDGENGKGFASDDLVAIADAMINEISTEEKYATFDGTPASTTKRQRSEAGSRIKQEWDGMSKDEKVKYAQNFDFTKYLTADYATGLTGTAIDNLYDTEIKPRAKWDKDNNLVERGGYLMDWWKDTATQSNLDIIEHKNNTLDNLDNWFRTENNDVVQKMKADANFDEYSPYLDHYFDENFKPRSPEEFANSYLKANPGEATDPEAFERLMQVYYGSGEPGWWSESMGTIGAYLAAPFVGAIPAVGSQLIDFSGKPSVDEEFHTMTPDQKQSMVDQLNAAEGTSYTVSDFQKPLPQGMGLSQAWKNGFSKHATPDGGAMYLGLMGNDSYASRGLNFPKVDPVAHQSSGTMNTMSFMKDVLAAGSGNSVLSLGGPEAELPENNAELDPILNQIYADLFNRADPKDKKRPILNVTYQGIAGGDREWTALNIKFNDPYLAQYTGSEDSPGIFRADQGTLRTDGMTLYLKKEAAKNGFAQGTSKTSLEHDLYWSGEHKITAYPEILSNVRLRKSDQGGFKISGENYNGLDANGNILWHSIDQYYPPGISPDEIRNRFLTGFAQTANQAYEAEMAEYMSTHPDFTKDPSQL